VGGNIDLPNSYNLGIKFYKCTEDFATSKGISCAEESVYLEKTKAMYFMLYYPSTVFDPVSVPPI
jgi:hypothetical protein